MPVETDVKDEGLVALRWWRAMQPQDRNGDAQPGDRAALARLRRCDPRAAMAEEATLRLFQRLGRTKAHELPRVATLACVLSTVREHEGRKFARAIGPESLEQKDIDKAPFKRLRFQRLIEAREEDEIARAFRRAVDIVARKGNVADLARIILSFDRDWTRQKLTFDYYNAGQAAPGGATETENLVENELSDDETTEG